MCGSSYRIRTNGYIVLVCGFSSYADGGTIISRLCVRTKCGSKFGRYLSVRTNSNGFLPICIRICTNSDSVITASFCCSTSNFCSNHNGTIFLCYRPGTNSECLRSIYSHRNTTGATRRCCHRISVSSNLK